MKLPIPALEFVTDIFFFLLNHFVFKVIKIIQKMIEEDMVEVFEDIDRLLKEIGMIFFFKQIFYDDS